ncbi:MAG: hypothetical protein AAF961_02315 [Planctomycetota bacterium]
MSNRPEYAPTPDQIAEACLEIRQNWSDSELRRRTVGYDLRLQERHWRVPSIDTSHCLARARGVVAEHSN